MDLTLEADQAMHAFLQGETQVTCRDLVLPQPEEPQFPSLKTVQEL